MIVNSLRVYLPKTVHDHGVALGVGRVGCWGFVRFWRLVVSVAVLRIRRECRVHVAGTT
jgi:hypothetical protein